MSGNESGEKKTRSIFYVIGLTGQVTFLLVLPVVIFLAVGLWMDSELDTAPLFTIIGVILGFAGSVWNVFRIMKLIERT